MVPQEENKATLKRQRWTGEDGLDRLTVEHSVQWVRQSLVRCYTGNQEEELETSLVNLKNNREREKKIEAQITLMRLLGDVQAEAGGYLWFWTTELSWDRRQRRGRTSKKIKSREGQQAAAEAAARCSRMHPNAMQIDRDVIARQGDVCRDESVLVLVS